MSKKPVKYCVVDAFTDAAFKGNPAAVCLLEEEREEKWLQSVAAEFNFSETCFLIRVNDSVDSTLTHPRFSLRWFTPVAEVELCGHATLAASYFLFAYNLVSGDTIEFSTLSGILTAKRIQESKILDSSNTQTGIATEGFFIELNFPVVPLLELDSSEIASISKSLNDASLLEIKKTSSDYLLVVLQSAKEVAEFQPNFDQIEKCPGRGMTITGHAPPESGFDFVSRFFSPKYGINEDPVTGSAHCALAPYWCSKLGKCDFVALQASPRSGVLNLHLDEKNQRVLLRGKGVAVMEGSLLV